MSQTLQAILDKLTEEDRAAVLRSISKSGPTKGQLRRTAPDWRKDPKAWAAWQGIRTALAIHGEFATFTLLMLDDESRKTWDRVSDVVTAIRREASARLI